MRLLIMLLMLLPVPAFAAATVASFNAACVTAIKGEIRNPARKIPPADYPKIEFYLKDACDCITDRLFAAGLTQAELDATEHFFLTRDKTKNPDLNRPYQVLKGSRAACYDKTPRLRPVFSIPKGSASDQ